MTFPRYNTTNTKTNLAAEYCESLISAMRILTYVEIGADTLQDAAIDNIAGFLRALYRADLCVELNERAHWIRYLLSQRPVERDVVDPKHTSFRLGNHYLDKKGSAFIYDSSFEAASDSVKQSMWETHCIVLRDTEANLLRFSPGQFHLRTEVRRFLSETESDVTRREKKFHRACQRNRSTFDLLLFDLDDTLVLSAHLASFRGRQNIGNNNPNYINELTAHAQKLSALLDQSVLLNIKTQLPGVKLGIVTKAPRSYAETLLKASHPQIRWDCVVAFEDVGGHVKPKPDAIISAARQTSLDNFDRVAVIGDEATDIIAAYQAGAYAVLSRIAWGQDWYDKRNPGRSAYYKALGFLPDAIADSPDDLINVLTHPTNSLLALEALDSMPLQSGERIIPRVDKLSHFPPSSLGDMGTPSVRVEVLGRYFSHRSSRFDFQARTASHEVTRKILEAKNGAEYPDHWVACCEAVVSRFAGYSRPAAVHFVVCPIPAKPGRRSRLERLVFELSQRFHRRADIVFDNHVLKFKDGVVLNKVLNKERRFENIRDHLYVDHKDLICGNDVMVIDDVTTTGATLYYANHYLRESGARRVYCVALTQTIS